MIIPKNETRIFNTKILKNGFNIAYFNMKKNILIVLFTLNTPLNEDHKIVIGKYRFLRLKINLTLSFV